MQKKEVTELISKLRAGDRRTLAKILSCVESQHPNDRQTVAEILQDAVPDTPPPPPSLRIGITGTAGVGKSSVIEKLGLHLHKEKKIAVLAIDPASPKKHGSILGDKLRMIELAKKERVFIRPLAGRAVVAGIHPRTFEMIAACEMAGYDTIIVETIGGGQTDYGIKDVVDVVVTLILPASGDSVQGMKKGVNEITDVFVINKYDGTNKTSASASKTALTHALHLTRSPAPIILTSAREHMGISELAEAITACADNRNRQHRETQKLVFFRTELAKLLGTVQYSAHEKLRAALEKKILAKELTPSKAYADAVLMFEKKL